MCVCFVYGSPNSIQFNSIQFEASVILLPPSVSLLSIVVVCARCLLFVVFVACLSLPCVCCSFTGSWKVGRVVCLRLRRFVLWRCMHACFCTPVRYYYTRIRVVVVFFCTVQSALLFLFICAFFAC